MHEYLYQVLVVLVILVSRDYKRKPRVSLLKNLPLKGVSILDYIFGQFRDDGLGIDIRRRWSVVGVH